MKAITNIDTNDTKASFGTNTNPVTAAEQETSTGRPESELRAAARRHGLNLKELADRMGVNYGYLSSVASGRRPWTPLLRERATAVLGEVPGQGIVYRQGGLVQGESTCIRERARELGLTQKDLAQRVGVSVGYMSEVARGRKNMSPAVQARVEIGAGRSGEDRARQLRQPAGRQGEREGAEQLHPGARPRAGHEPQGPGGTRGGVLRLHDPGVPGRKEHEPGGPGAGGRGAGRSGQGRTRPASHRRSARPVGPHGCPPAEPERDRPAGRHQLRSSLPDHERPAKPVGGGPGEAARCACSGLRRRSWWCPPRSR